MNRVLVVHVWAADEAFQAPTHALGLYTLSMNYPELYAHCPQGPYKNYEGFKNSFIGGPLAQDNENLTYAIIDKTSSSLARVATYTGANPTTRSLTIGALFILPSYQGTHFTTNTVGLMLQYALNSPFDGGLGLVRVQWRLDSLYECSSKLAETMGFKYEGKQRWFRLIKNGLDRGKVGNGKPPPPPAARRATCGRTGTHFLCAGMTGMGVVVCRLLPR